MFVFLDNDFVPSEKAALPVNDLAINRAYGVFDFFQVKKGKPVFLKEHLARFMNSASEMRLQLPFNATQLRDITNELINKNQVAEGGIKLVLTGGSSEDGYTIGAPRLIITQHILKPAQFETIKLVSYEHRRQIPHVKTIDYILPVWLQPMLTEKNANDFLYHDEGIVTECPRANFFIVTKDKRIVTPATNILKGITRNILFNMDLPGYTLQESLVSLTDVMHAEEAFITSTTKGVMRVAEVDGKKIGIKTTATDMLREKLEAAIESQVSG